MKVLTEKYPAFQAGMQAIPRFRLAQQLIVAALVFVVAVVDASAQGQITVARIEAPRESMVMMPVSYVASGSQPPSTLVLRLAYPAATLEMLEVVASPPLIRSGKEIDPELRSGSIAIAVFGGTEPVPDGTLLYLLMRVKPAAQIGNTLSVLNTTTHGADSDAEHVAVQVTSGHVRVIDSPAKHSADTTGDWSITLPELLRVIQLYNALVYHCDPLSEDGYGPGPGDQNCAHHDADYAPADWSISFSELLRIIQFYNSPYRMYHADPDGEDGFAPGPFGYAP